MNLFYNYIYYEKYIECLGIYIIVENAIEKCLDRVQDGHNYCQNNIFKSGIKPLSLKYYGTDVRIEIHGKIMKFKSSVIEI